MTNTRVLSIGSIGNTEIDIAASASYPWCDSVYLKPHKGASKLMSKKEVDSLNIDLKEYKAVLLWHQVPNEPTLALLNRIFKINPSVLILGNSHGYNKSISELIDLYGLRVPQICMDYYSMWGPYFTDRYKEIYQQNPYANHIVSLGSLRHDHLYKNFRWNKNKTNSKILVIHEPVTSESWSDPSPIGDNRVTESIIEHLEKSSIPFDFKVHPNWPDFISNSGKPMWNPPEHVNVVNIAIQDMIEYDAVIASWSSIQFEALAMNMPVINIKYDYPKVNNSEWGPGKLGLLKGIEPEEIPAHLENTSQESKKVDRNLLNYFLGNLGRVESTYYPFIQKEVDRPGRMRMKLMRKSYNCSVHRMLRALKDKLPI